MASYTDKTLTCRDCGANFEFSAGEQEFYASKGLLNEPSRCPACRSARRGARDGGGYSSAPRPAREMHDVVCDDCGKETQVPFLPRGDRPVYCSDCFARSRSR
jgi:CxxC-x17-CxxC domain-containing protein